MQDSFISPEEAEEALERNKKLALEGTIDMKAPNEVGIDLESIKPEISNAKSKNLYENIENINNEQNRDLWDYIFMLTDEIKRLKGELNAR